MPETESHNPGDRRLQSLVFELDKKVHALELTAAKDALEISYLKGEVNGIRSTTASSFELQAASKVITQNVEALSDRMKASEVLTNERLDNIRKDFSRLQAVLVWVAVTVVGVLVAALQFKIVVVP